MTRYSVRLTLEELRADTAESAEAAQVTQAPRLAIAVTPTDSAVVADPSLHSVLIGLR